MTALVIGGAFFGDNLSFISDTTIAATRTQGCVMRDKFRVNFLIAVPAALLVFIYYIIYGTQVESASEIHAIEWGKVIPLPHRPGYSYCRYECNSGPTPWSTFNRYHRLYIWKLRPFRMVCFHG